MEDRRILSWRRGKSVWSADMHWLLPLVISLLAAFTVSGALAYYVDYKRSITFSRFWHSVREELREALEENRGETRG